MYKQRFNVAIGNFDMNSLILDLRPHVNILLKKTWEEMGKPQMVSSPFKLRLANQHKIYPIGRLEDVEVDIDGVKSTVEFEVIEIIDDTKPYPTLLGIDYGFDNLVVLNLKKRQMSFESEDLRVVALLDPDEGDRYIEPMREDLKDIDLENFYKVIARWEDYINPTVDRNMSWTSINSFSSNSDDALENLKHILYDVSTSKCGKITKFVCHTGTKVWEPPRFDGLREFEEFIEEFEEKVPREV